MQTCNPVSFQRKDYFGLGRVRKGANIESGVAMFNRAVNNPCGVSKYQEHDVILAVKRWAPSGHGAWVQQMTVRAAREGWKNMVSWPNIYPASPAQEQLVCRDGYGPNGAHTDCVPLDEVLCATAQTCSGWTDFDESIHKLIMPTGRNCYEFVSKEENTAFVSTTDHSCVECVSTLRSGVSPVDGTCVKCDSGMMFNKSAETVAGLCTEAVAYTKTDMQYGKGKTKNTVTALENQCWTKVETDVYRKCVVTGEQ